MRQLQFSYQIEDAITPLDGRNRHKLNSLSSLFSEKVLNRNRIYVEIEYLKALSSYKVIRSFTQKEIKYLDGIVGSFDTKIYKALREIELVTNHDVQAIIVYIQKQLEKTSLRDVTEMIHFGLTSEDINNLAYALMTRNTVKEILVFELQQLESLLKKTAISFKQVPMLGRTHGQSAATTTYGKEMAVYKTRLSSELELLKKCKLHAKLNGNVGNFNAHTFISPQTNWVAFSKSFISSLGFIPDLQTTQIEPYESYIYLFQTLKRINNILIGFCKDIWMYAMLGYIDQKVINKEVGSSALPHKVNPIYFEGAEGGFGLANSLFTFYEEKLSYSRLQRDLSDSTVRRTFGIAFAYSLLSYQSVLEGLHRIIPNKRKMNEDLEKHYEILSEAVQSMLRSKGVKASYQKAKDFFRGTIVTKEAYQAFIKTLPFGENDKKKLIQLTPQTYVGYAERLAQYEK